MATEKEYNEASDMVYWLDSNHEDYDPSIIEGSFQNIGGKRYQILKIKTEPSNGMQAMAIAPLDSNGYPDTTQLTVAFAGTNFGGDWRDVVTDAQTVGLSMTQLGWNPGQADSAQEFADWIKLTYPHAVVTTTGHSLGEYLALMIAAENEWRNVGFNGPDPYGILSTDAKKWIKDNPGMLTNYRNFADLIGNLMGNGTGAEIMIGYTKGSPGNPLEAHALTLWKFDEDGRLRVPDNTYALMDGQQLEQNLMSKFVMSMYLLKTLEAKLNASGGGLSGTEEIYLDATRAKSIVTTASSLLKVAMSKIIAHYQGEMDKTEELWNKILTSARGASSDLSESEMESQVATVGFTKARIVNTPKEKYQQKIQEAKQVGETFESLASEINAKIIAVVQQDQDLARQLQF
ncbi:lipase [Enterococcus ureasiticus]|uniref:lipase n=1 Tax=Enterococcus ureasiticus TaxID=903984 RepID=UPI001A8F62EB|nr:lipase [Enterococcus ureasiticus]MBO0474321.1 lipase [Enterococcus ureasiticus]